jgi:hypothetical protein
MSIHDTHVCKLYIVLAVTGLALFLLVPMCFFFCSCYRTRKGGPPSINCCVWRGIERNGTTSGAIEPKDKLRVVGQIKLIGIGNTSDYPCRRGFLGDVRVRHLVARVIQRYVKRRLGLLLASAPWKEDIAKPSGRLHANCLVRVNSPWRK